MLEACNIGVWLWGLVVRSLALVLSGLVGSMALASQASAATIYFYVDAMTLEQRSIKIDMDGPDKAYLCVLPPGTTGCQEVPLKRRAR